MALSKEFLIASLSFIANGNVVENTVTGSGTTTNVYTPSIVKQIIFLMKNNGVVVSQTTATVSRLSDSISANGVENVNIVYIGTDASNYSYTTDEIEVWGASNTALLYKIADITPNNPISKSDDDYLQVQYSITIKACTSYTAIQTASTYISNSVNVKVPTSPFLYLMLSMLIPDLITILKKNPTYPLSQLVNYINLSNYQGIDTAYIGSSQIDIINTQVGYGNGIAKLVVNTQFSGNESGISTFGFTSAGVYIPLLVYTSSSYTPPYLSFSVSIQYGSGTLLTINQTSTTGDSQ